MSIAGPRASAQTAQFVFAPVSGFDSAAPGSSITFSINLVFTSGNGFNDVQGLTYFIQQNGAAPFVFTLTGRNATGSPFSDLTQASPTTPASAAALNPSNDKDLGGVADSPLGDSPSEGYFVANITLQLNNSAVVGNSYTVSSTTAAGETSVINNSDGNTFPIQPGSVTVTVVPEPSSIALLGLASVGLGIVAYRRRSAA